jgi:7-carboxy-7-deazaguanine synthase
MKVCEIFKSIQGESSYAGLPCVFIRLSGCNLRCRYCDTQYAWEGGGEMPLDEIIGMVKGFCGPPLPPPAASGGGAATASSCGRLVEVTGGEPLMQEGALELIDRLVYEGMKVLVETNGSMDIRWAHKSAVIIMDIKTPSSGVSDKMRFSNIECLKPFDEVKFVIADRADYEWSKKTADKYFLTGRCEALFSPVNGVLAPDVLAGWIIADGLDVRLNVQLHKYIFGDKRGV